MVIITVVLTVATCVCHSIYAWGQDGTEVPSGCYPGLTCPFSNSRGSVHTWPFRAIFWQLPSYWDSWKICQPWVPMHYWYWQSSSCCIALSLSDRNRKGILCLLFPLEASHPVIQLFLKCEETSHIWSSPWAASSKPVLGTPYFFSAVFHGWLKMGECSLWEWGQS